MTPQQLKRVRRKNFRRVNAVLSHLRRVEAIACAMRRIVNDTVKAMELEIFKKLAP